VRRWPRWDWSRPRAEIAALSIAAGCVAFALLAVLGLGLLLVMAALTCVSVRR
jgi:hypothetical protein